MTIEKKQTLYAKLNIGETVAIKDSNDAQIFVTYIFYMERLFKKSLNFTCVKLNGNYNINRNEL